MRPKVSGQLQKQHHGLALKDRALALKEQGLALREQSLALQEKALALKRQSSALAKQGVALKDFRRTSEVLAATRVRLPTAEKLKLPWIVPAGREYWFYQVITKLSGKASVTAAATACA